LIGSGLDLIRPTISGVTFCGWRSDRFTALEAVNPNTIRLTRSLCDQGCDKIGQEKLL
jgi:hypothetical protein